MPPFPLSQTPSPSEVTEAYGSPVSASVQVSLRITAPKGPRAHAYCSTAGPTGQSALVIGFKPP